MFDLLLKNASVLDGTGSPAYPGCVGIQGDRIEAIGDLAQADADRVIDVQGLTITPGFVDLHAHSDLLLSVPPDSQVNLMGGRIAQGITTEVGGNCGIGVAPCDDRSRPIIRGMAGIIDPPGAQWSWSTMGGFLDRLEQQGICVNLAVLTGHGPVRVTAAGLTPQPPTQDALSHMERLIAQSLEAGSIGLSFGLIYAPGMYATTQEIVRLCRIVERYKGIAAFHQRGGGSGTLVKTMEELIEIARASGVHVHQSHDHIQGFDDLSALDQVQELVDRTRETGTSITSDVFPYISVCTMMMAIYPPWSLEGGPQGLIRRLSDRKERERIRTGIETIVPQWPPWEPGSWPLNTVKDVGWENLLISFVPGEKNKPYEMKSIAEIAAMTNKEPFDAISDIMIEEQGCVTMMIFGLNGDRDNDEPLRSLLRHPFKAFSTDAWDLGTGRPHPGAYGAFPRILGHYVRDEGVLPLEEAIRKMTHLPATWLGLERRGLVKEGYYADLVVLDPATVADHSTYDAPRTGPEGIPYVLINGRLAVDGGKVVGGSHGRVLRRGRDVKPRS